MIELNWQSSIRFCTQLLPENIWQIRMYSKAPINFKSHFTYLSLKYFWDLNDPFCKCLWLKYISLSTSSYKSLFLSSLDQESEVFVESVYFWHSLQALNQYRFIDIIVWVIGPTRLILLHNSKNISLNICIPCIAVRMPENTKSVDTAITCFWL